MRDAQQPAPAAEATMRRVVLAEMTQSLRARGMALEADALTAALSAKDAEIARLEKMKSIDNALMTQSAEKILEARREERERAAEIVDPLEGCGCDRCAVRRELAAAIRAMPEVGTP